MIERTERAPTAIYALLALCATLLLVAGCGPSGPRSVLKGERLIQEKKYPQAVEQLQQAIRLIPTNAQAWNHLGLALHHNKQPKEALKAYRQALALDRKLNVVHYNIGCLLLEQNDPAGAIDPLTSYTYLQPRSASGWLKLGTAQLRARKFDAAEISFKRTLELEPKNTEAANNLGVAQANRKRPFEALASFNQALRHNSHHSAALLNSSLVTYQQLNNPAIALQKARQYMALKPPAAQVAALTPFVNRLETDLNPPKPAVAATPIAPVRSATNAVVPTNPPARVEIAVTNNVPRTNPMVAAIPKPVPPPAASNAPIGRGVAAAPPPTNKTETVAALVHSVPRKTDVEVTRLTDDFIVTPAQDVTAPTRLGRDASPYPAGTPSPNSSPAQNEKRTLISRLNPFNGKTSEPEPRTPAPLRTDDGRANRPGEPRLGKDASPYQSGARYQYMNPQPGRAGNRAEAIRVLAEGVKAHQARKLSQALLSYERAAQADPSFFEAQYNLGLALSESGNTKRALAVFENAMALRSDSADARYNFALALKQADFPVDAAQQLERIVRGNPNDTRAHLSLGNLYAQKLDRPDLARDHYRRVLEREPNHPQAGQIRLWLVGNPR
jgi:tetratricopeptide (TPR) repeat protein